MIVASGQGAYPWDGDPLITHAWVMDPAYVTTASGAASSVAPEKGTIPLVQATSTMRPAYSATGYGTGSKGFITSDGVDDHLRGDALAAFVTGLNKPFTKITSLQLLSLTTDRRPWEFNGASGQATRLEVRAESGPPTVWGILRNDDAGDPTLVHVGANSLNLLATVVTVVFDGSSMTLRLGGAATGITNQPSVYGTQTFNSFALCAQAGGGQAVHCKLRTHLFAPAALPLSSIAPYESFLLAE